MHPLSSAAYQQSMAGYGSGMEGQQSPPEGAGSPQDPANGSSGTDQNGSGGTNYSDINQILDQILNITDQSLDEAQVNLKSFIDVNYLLSFECSTNKETNPSNLNSVLPFVKYLYHILLQKHIKLTFTFD